MTSNDPQIENSNVFAIGEFSICIFYVHFLCFRRQKEEMEAHVKMYRKANIQNFWNWLSRW